MTTPKPYEIRTPSLGRCRHPREKCKRPETWGQDDTPTPCASNSVRILHILEPNAKCKHMEKAESSPQWQWRDQWELSLATNHQQMLGRKSTCGNVCRHHEEKYSFLHVTPRSSHAVAHKTRKRHTRRGKGTQNEEKGGFISDVEALLARRARTVWH